MTSFAATGTSATFADRHIGPDADGMATDAASAGPARSGRAGIGRGAGDHPRRPARSNLPAPASETETLAELRALAAKNRPMVQMIGLGYHDTITPGVIKRNVLENPAWYTAYTPYQPEISQGRLEALLNFQTAVSDLTGLDIANASMLDEATAAAEAMTLIKRTAKSKSQRFVVDADTLPQTIAVIRTRAEPIGIEVVVADLSAGVEALPVGDFFGLLLSYPGASGAVRDHRGADRGRAPAGGQGRGRHRPARADPARARPARSAPTSPSARRSGSGCRWASVVRTPGSSRSAAEIQRQLPGRLVGVSHDAHGTTAFRLALQTREQHIRREKATSNICTAQVLLAVMASMYAVYHGPGWAAADRRAGPQPTRCVWPRLLEDGGVEVEHALFFDTVRVRVPGRARAIVAGGRERGINLWADGDDAVQISVSEATTGAHLRCRGRGVRGDRGDSWPLAADAAGLGVTRTSEFLTHPVFHAHRSETAMLRYLRRLSDMDLALDRTMIPLGSCTMKLNATTEMEAVDLAGVRRAAPVRPGRGRGRVCWS